MVSLYRNQGYDFTITSSTAFDHKWIPERNIFQSISVIVDELFADYLSRPNVRQPILTQYCDGRQVQCPNWMTQWGSKSLGDQGYSAIQDSLEQYFSVSRLVLLAGIGAWLGLLLLFLLLCPLMQRKNAARMWSLGASERQVGRHVLAGGMGLAAPGVLLGALLGYVLTEKLTARLAAEAELELTLRSQPWVTALIALIQLALCLGAVALCALVLVRGARKGRR